MAVLRRKRRQSDVARTASTVPLSASIGNVSTGSSVDMDLDIASVAVSVDATRINGIWQLWYFPTGGPSWMLTDQVNAGGVTVGANSTTITLSIAVDDMDESQPYALVIPEGNRGVVGLMGQLLSAAQPAELTTPALFIPILKV